MRYTLRIASAIALLLSSTPILRADETVDIGGSNAVLLGLLRRARASS